MNLLHEIQSAVRAFNHTMVLESVEDPPLLAAVEPWHVPERSPRRLREIITVSVWDHHDFKVCVCEDATSVAEVQAKLQKALQAARARREGR